MANDSSARAESCPTPQNARSSNGAPPIVAKEKARVVLHAENSSLGTNFNVRTLQGRQLFRCQRQRFGFAKERALLDADKTPQFILRSVGDYRREIFRWGVPMKVAAIEKRFKFCFCSIIRIELRVGASSGEGSCELLKVKGSFSNRELAIVNGKRTLGYLVLPGRWGPDSVLEVAAGVDLALMVSIAIMVLDLEAVEDL